MSKNCFGSLNVLLKEEGYEFSFVVRNCFKYSICKYVLRKKKLN